MIKAALTAVGLMLVATSCAGGIGGNSASDSSGQLATPEEIEAAAIARDTLRTYAVAAQCAMLAYLDATPTPEEHQALERLKAAGIVAATDPSEALAGHIAGILNGARRTPGFKAQVFHDAPGRRYIIAFAGTEPHAPDIITDIDGAFSIDEPQNTAALRLTDSIGTLLASAGLTDHTILLTGHSLGGRLASVAAIEHEADAVVFNPANIPIDLQRRIEDDKKLRAAAESHIVRIHSAADELTGGVKLAEQLSPYIPYLSAAVDSGLDWLDDRSSLSTIKGIISSSPEIAGAVGAVWEWISPSESAKPEASASSLSRILVEMLAHMRQYGVSTADLQNPLFYQYRGRSVALPYLTGGHAIAPIAIAIDSAYQAQTAQ